MIAPTIGATIYNQSTETFFETTVGEILRAGFMDAPQMEPANVASNNNTTPPLGSPAYLFAGLYILLPLP